jgi:hypothetical protein
MTEKRNDFRILVSIPTERNVNALAFWPFMEIARQGWDFLEMPYTMTPVARNKMAMDALTGNYDALVMLDSDMIHPKDVVQRLARWAISDKSRQVIGGLGFRRGAPFDPCAFILNDEDKMCALHEWPQGLVKVDVVGFAAVLICREVFAQIERPWFEYKWLDGDTMMSEDVVFCRKCREKGIPVYVDTTIISGHLVDALVDEKAYRSFMKTQSPGEPLTRTTEVWEEKEKENAS